MNLNTRALTRNYGARYIPVRSALVKRDQPDKVATPRVNLSTDRSRYLSVGPRNKTKMPSCRRFTSTMNFLVGKRGYDSYGMLTTKAVSACHISHVRTVNVLRMLALAATTLFTIATARETFFLSKLCWVPRPGNRTCLVCELRSCALNLTSS